MLLKYDGYEQRWYDDVFAPDDEEEQSHLRTRDARALRDDNMLDRTRVGLQHFAENQEVNLYAVGDLETDNNFHTFRKKLVEHFKFEKLQDIQSFLRVGPVK